MAHHGVGVHLAHVEAAITGFYVGNLEVPVLVVIAGQRKARVLGDDGVVDGEDGLRLHEDPCHLGRGRGALREGLDR